MVYLRTLLPKSRYFLFNLKYIGLTAIFYLYFSFLLYVYFRGITITKLLSRLQVRQAGHETAANLLTTLTQNNGEHAEVST